MVHLGQTFAVFVYCNDIDKILDLLPVSVPVSYVTVVMVTRHAFRGFRAVEFLSYFFKKITLSRHEDVFGY